MALNDVKSAIKKVRIMATILQILGSIITFFCGIITITATATVGFEENINTVMIIIFASFTSIGILLIVKGNKKKQLIKTFYNYSTRLASDPNKSIATLASAVGLPVAVVIKKLSDMISFGFFQDVYIDTKNNCLVFHDGKASVNNSVQNNTNTFSPNVKYASVQCMGCGATNKIIAGTVGECEFCGSQISEN